MRVYNVCEIDTRYNKIQTIDSIWILLLIMANSSFSAVGLIRQTQANYPWIAEKHSTGNFLAWNHFINRKKTGKVFKVLLILIKNEKFKPLKKYIELWGPFALKNLIKQKL